MNAPKRNATTVRVDPKGTQTSAQGGPISNTPQRNKVGAAKAPKRTSPNIPVHNMRDSGSSSASGGPAGGRTGYAD